MFFLKKGELYDHKFDETSGMTFVAPETGYYICTDKTVKFITDILPQTVTQTVHLAEYLLSSSIITTSDEYFEIVNGFSNMRVQKEIDDHNSQEDQIESKQLENYTFGLPEGYEIDMDAVVDHQMHIDEHNRILKEKMFFNNSGSISHRKGYVSENYVQNDDSINTPWNLVDSNPDPIYVDDKNLIKYQLESRVTQVLVNMETGEEIPYDEEFIKNMRVE
jgi:hypothetical protein